MQLEIANPKDVQDQVTFRQGKGNYKQHIQALKDGQAIGIPIGADVGKARNLAAYLSRIAGVKVSKGTSTDGKMLWITPKTQVEPAAPAPAPAPAPASAAPAPKRGK